MIGTSLGPSKIIEPLGAGGMGQKRIGARFRPPACTTSFRSTWRARACGDVMVVEVSPETGVPSDRPRTLFTSEPGLELGPRWDIHPDGYFLMLRAGPEPPPANRLELIDNWFEELKQRVPRGR